MNAFIQQDSVKFSRRSCLVMGIATSMGLPAWAEEAWPSRPIRMVAPIAAGGLTDTLARLIAKQLTDRLGQQVIVENRPGGGGVIGMTSAARAPGDGYNLVLVYQGVASVNPVLYPDLVYDTLRDFTPISEVATFPLALIASTQSGVTDLEDFLKRAKAQPGKISYASAGNATTSHLTMELFKRATGLQLNHIPYKGEAPALTDLMGGQVDVAFSSLGSVLPHIASGRLRVLGITSPQRSPIAPQFPTVAEAGVPNFQSSGWYGVLAPRGTPKAVVERLSAELASILTNPEVKKAMLAQAIVPHASSSEELQKLIVDETRRWRALITEAGIKAD